MKTIIRRIRLLENQFSPPVDEKERRLVAEIRERRRRRLEASGEPPGREALAHSCLIKPLVSTT
jgi:hypothetical protein